jgi:hypothetical protein
MPDEQKQDHYCFRLGDLSVDPVEEGKRNAPFREWLIAVGYYRSLVLDTK